MDDFNGSTEQIYDLRRRHENKEHYTSKLIIKLCDIIMSERHFKNTWQSKTTFCVAELEKLGFKVTVCGKRRYELEKL